METIEQLNRILLAPSFSDSDNETTMSTKINPPDYSNKTYEQYKIELQAWQKVTSLTAEKQGIAIALSLPESDSSCIRQRVFEELSLEDLGSNDGMKKLFNFLDEKLGKDDLADSLEKFEDFDDFVRLDDQAISDFITQFDQRYNRIVKKGMKLPAEILAFQLLKRAKITSDEKLLVLTGMDYSQKETLYDQAKKSLKKFKGKEAGCRETQNPAIKIEPAFIAENEDAFVAAGYKVVPLGRSNWRGRSGPIRYRGPTRGAGVQRKVNPPGKDGRPITCRACGSYRHLIADCPDSWENQDKNALANEVMNTAVLFTGNKKDDIVRFGVESRCCAVLDSACTSTVCGIGWMRSFLECLESSERDKVIKRPGEKTFKFGGGELLKSMGAYEIPVTLAGKKVTIAADVVESDIPLLLSAETMKAAKVKLNLEDDTAEILGSVVALDFTSAGHYCVPLDNASNRSVESVCAVDLGALGDAERVKALLKLHRQFAHPPTKKLASLLKDAGVWQDEFFSRTRIDSGEM